LFLVAKITHPLILLLRHTALALSLFGVLSMYHLEVLATTEHNTVTHIVTLGDSLTEGYGIEKDKAYPALVEKKLLEKGYSVKIFNAGISGSTTASAPSRLKWLLKSKPHIVFIALGANDGLRGVTIETTKQNLKNTIQIAKNAQVKIWLAGMKLPPNYGKTYTAQFETMFQEIAKEEDIPLLPFLLEEVAGQVTLNQPDGIHPNEKGHQIMAEVVSSFFQKELNRLYPK
jgi:acyl-CoA thioesterase I